MHDLPLSDGELARRGLDAAEHLGRGDPLWPGQLATFTALLLYLLLPPQLTLGPNWLAPLAVGASLIGLIVAGHAGRGARRRREIAIGLVSLAVLANLVALGFLVHFLVGGGHARGEDLIGGGVLIWTVNLLLFTVLYWELDRGGPLRPDRDPTPVLPDFLFPQMSDERYAAPGWKPGFGDYLYVSGTNQTAFSPTDTMPLRMRAKLLMGVQGTAAFVTAGVVVAHAVNILG